MNKKDKVDLLKDYEECLRKMKNFNNNNYKDYEEWATRKYSEWILKDDEYVAATPIAIFPPRDDIEKAWNILNNFRITLINIARNNEMNL